MLKFLIIIIVFLEIENIESETTNQFCESINNMCNFGNKMNHSINVYDSNDTVQQQISGNVLLFLS
jgi:hypothetical protein